MQTADLTNALAAATAAPVVDEQESEGLLLFRRRVKRQEIVYLASQLGIMVETGVNLAAALEGLAEQEENATLHSILVDLRHRVEAGEDFSTALARHPKQFDKTFVSLVRASEQTGTLGPMLQQLSEYLSKELENRGKVRSALTYPTVMLAVAAGVTIFLLTYVLPKFSPLFERKGVRLPKSTQLMMIVSDSLLGYWWAWAIGVVVVVVGGWFWARTKAGRSSIDWCKIHAPLVGPMFRKVTISRCLRTLGVMVGNGVSMLDAVQLTSDVSGNTHYEREWMQVLDQITNGRRVCEALGESQLFPKPLIQMIASGEDTGRLDFVLDKVSGHYERDVDMSLKTMTSLLEPLMITVMGVVVGGIAMSLLLPIFQLSRAAG
ncbi:MAG: type II secretion system F family protein [Pirellulaceae bacterium]|nr:type II secretion system F family protein [Pirellulaceae bacterium]